MSKKQKKMLLRIIIAAVIWAAGFIAQHIFPAEERFSLLDILYLVIFTAA